MTQRSRSRVSLKHSQYASPRPTLHLDLPTLSQDIHRCRSLHVSRLHVTATAVGSKERAPPNTAQLSQLLRQDNSRFALLRAYSRGNIFTIAEFTMFRSVELEVCMVKVGNEIAFVGEENAEVEMHKFGERFENLREGGLIIRG